MVQLITRDGIKCDLCNMVLKDNFLYYSYDLHRATILNGRHPSILRANRSNPIRSIDVCGNCHSKFSNLIVNANKKLLINQIRGLAYCELTGDKINDGNALLVFVTLISVNLKTKSVKSDTNFLSFLVSKNMEKSFETKQITDASDTWEVKS